MTDSNKTLIAALLDRSGSMTTSKKATEDGFDKLIKDQREQPGECLITLAQFDYWHHHDNASQGEQSIPEFVYRSRSIREVPRLTLQPRGSTPLLDAVGNFVTLIGLELAELDEQDRPGQVICLIMTDGMENASHEWTWDMVRDLITQQRDQWQWEFIFIGANIDAVKVGSNIGVSLDMAATYDSHDYTSNVAAYGATSANISSLRSGGPGGFTDDDRKTMNNER